MPRKARVEGAVAETSDGKALARIVDAFKAEYPDQWEAAKLGPLEHGLTTMVDLLDG